MNMPATQVRLGGRVQGTRQHEYAEFLAAANSCGKPLGAVFYIHSLPPEVFFRDLSRPLYLRVSRDSSLYLSGGFPTQALREPFSGPTSTYLRDVYLDPKSANLESYSYYRSTYLNRFQGF
jgi:hypothetical protein